MSSTTASHVKDAYLASGIDEWLSNFGTIYYHPEAATDSNNIERTYTLTDGNYRPNALIDFDSGELVAITAINGTDWQAANTHLNEYWQNADNALQASCFEMPAGDQFLDGILAVSPYSPFGALFNTDELESEHFPGTPEYANSRPLTMLYKEQAIEWTKQTIKDIVTDSTGGAVGVDFVGVLISQTTGNTDVPIGLYSETSDKTRNWSTGTTQFVE